MDYLKQPSIMINSFSDIALNFSLNPITQLPGFHGDINLINLADELLKKSSKFIETGANLGNTLYFVSNNYDIKCFSCEIHSETPKVITEHKNVFFEQKSSPQFIYDLPLTQDVCTFWLDAHSGKNQTIHLEELQFIINNYSQYYIFIDDVNINLPGWTHNNYSVSDIINILGENDSIYSPNYLELDNPFHGKTGWVLITNLDFTTKENLKLLT